MKLLDIKIPSPRMKSVRMTGSLNSQSTQSQKMKKKLLLLLLLVLKMTRITSLVMVNLSQNFLTMKMSCSNQRFRMTLKRLRKKIMKIPQLSL